MIFLWSIYSRSEPDSLDYIVYIYCIYCRLDNDVAGEKEREEINTQVTRTTINTRMTSVSIKQSLFAFFSMLLRAAAAALNGVLLVLMFSLSPLTALLYANFFNFFLFSYKNFITDFRVMNLCGDGLTSVWFFWHVNFF